MADIREDVGVSYEAWAKLCDSYPTLQALFYDAWMDKLSPEDEAIFWRCGAGSAYQSYCLRIIYERLGKILARLDFQSRI